MNGVAADPHRANNHLVSKGYQVNFAGPGDRLAILSATTGKVVDNRPVKTNWALRDFLTVTRVDGSLDDSLERDFGKVERKVLNQIRDITNTVVTPEQKEALDQVAGIHLVRSLSFAARHEEVVEQWFNDSVGRFSNDPHVYSLFEKEHGRSPEPDELRRMVTEVAMKAMMAGDRLTGGMRRGADALPEILANWRVQLVEAPDSMPGFVLADQPIVHALAEEGRYGFRSGLAVGDANLLLMPIRRRLAAFFTARPLRHFTLRTKRGLDTINAVFCRSASVEVACHPDDALTTSRLIRNLNRYPASALHDGRLR